MLTILSLSLTLLFDLYHNTNLEYSTTLSLLEYERERGNEIEMRSNVLIVEEEKDVTIQLCKKCHKNGITITKFKHIPMPGTMITLQTERILPCLSQNLKNSIAYIATNIINALCITTKFDKPTHRTYFKWLFVELLWNCLEEAASARDRICSAPCERLERSAVCVVDAKLRRREKASELVVVQGN